MLCSSAEYTPSGTREWLVALLLRSAVRVALKPVLSPKVPIAWQRRWLRQVARATGSSGGTDIQPGVAGGVKGEWVRPRRGRSAAAQADPGVTILYLHGGGYCVGSPATHRAVTSRLARATGLPTFVADYRLAPEHPFPAAVDDAVSAYRSLLQIGPVVIAGDSAGGGLALATALAARQLQMGPPAALVLFSPWVDLTISAGADKAAKGEVVLRASWLNACARHYLAGKDARTPLASPLYADPRGLPPTLIQAGADELLHGDAVRIHDALSQAGVTVCCEIVPARWHTFQLHAGMLAAANAAIDRAARFIARQIAS
jgi:acetyl esterase/lipase